MKVCMETKLDDVLSRSFELKNTNIDNYGSHGDHHHPKNNMYYKESDILLKMEINMLMMMIKCYKLSKIGTFILK